MFFRALIFFTAFLLACCSYAYAGEWPRFQADNRHTGASSVNFPSKDFQCIWKFRPAEHVFKYKRGSNVWSDSACIANVDGKDVVFIGLYNHNLYAVDAQDGRILWHFITGGRLDSSPCFTMVGGKPVVYIVSADRVLYALDARTGGKIFSYETLEWSYTVSEAVSTSPLVVSINGRAAVIFCIWNNDRAPMNNIQRGELFALDAATGEKIYSKVLSSVPLNSPAFSSIADKPVLFISSTDGRVFGVDARDGSILWEKVLCAQIHSSVSVNIQKDKIQVFVGTGFGNLYALDGHTGNILWAKKFGHAIYSTIAIAGIEGKVFIYFGSQDRNIYCLEAETGKEVWRFKTRDYVTSSCVIAKALNSTVIFAHSLDNNLYCLDALTGSRVWSRDTGKLIWGYYRGHSVNWSSPAVCAVSGRPLLVFPSYDGSVYAFGSSGKSK